MKNLKIEMPKENLILPSQLSLSALHTEINSYIKKYGTFDNFPFYISQRVDNILTEILNRETPSDTSSKKEVDEELKEYFKKYKNTLAMPFAVIKRVLSLIDTKESDTEEIKTDINLDKNKLNILKRINFMRNQVIQKGDGSSSSKEKLKIGQAI